MDFDYEKLMRADKSQCYGHLINCKLKNKCPSFCSAFHMLQLMYGAAGVPKKYLGEKQLLNNGDEQAFAYLSAYTENVFSEVRKGRGLYLWSKSKGNGKTTWACNILQAYFKQILKNRAFTMSRPQAVFVNVPDLFMLLRDFQNKADEIEKIRRNVTTAELVIWDDIGAEVPTTWVREQLYVMINTRDSYLRCNIYTSNVSVQDLSKEAWLGERTGDRIMGHAEIIHFAGGSMRGV